MGDDWTTGPKLDIDLNYNPNQDSDERYADGQADLIGNTITALMGAAAAGWQYRKQIKEGFKRVIPGPWDTPSGTHQNGPKRIEPVRPKDERFDRYSKAMVPYESTLLPVWGMPVKEAPERFYPPGLPAPPFRKLPPQGPKLPFLQTTKRTGVIPPPAERTVIPPFKPATNQTIPPLDEKDHNITHPAELNFTDAYESSTFDSFGVFNTTPLFNATGNATKRRHVKHEQKPIKHEDFVPDPVPDPTPTPAPTPEPTPTGRTSIAGGGGGGGGGGRTMPGLPCEFAALLQAWAVYLCTKRILKP